MYKIKKGEDESTTRLILQYMALPAKPYEQLRTLIECATDSKCIRNCAMR